MKIAVDSWVLASRFRHHGTQIYARNLIAEFQKIVKTRKDVSFCTFRPSKNSDDAPLIHPSERFEVMESGLLSHDRLWRLGGISRTSIRAGADMIFAPTLSAFPLGPLPMVCTIHDVTPLRMPSHSFRVMRWQRSLLWLSARRARRIITVSQCSKKDLIELYGLPESRVRVVYNGFEKALFNDQPLEPQMQKALLARLGLQRPYILHHGVIQPRKNLERLIDAYRLLLSRNSALDFDLVLAGAQGWACEEILTAARASGPGRVILTGGLSGQDLATLVKAASLVVIPSLYEGFCLPMVEAMACGVPVIAANNSCLPEISAGVLKYFDPYSIEDIAATVKLAIEDAELRKMLVQEGKKRAAFFDWRRCAEQTLSGILGSSTPEDGRNSQ